MSLWSPPVTNSLPSRPIDAPTRDPTSQPLLPGSSRAASYVLELGTSIAQVAQAGFQATAAFASALPAPWTESIQARLRLGTPANNQPSVQAAGAGAPIVPTASNMGAALPWIIAAALGALILLPRR
jgi:hypothetical protein